MMKKNGFIAVSLIYSFFLVFLMIMLSSSVKNAETRQMLKSLKEDIKTNLDGEDEFIITTLPKKNPITSLDYKEGDEVNFVGESWLVLYNNPNSVGLVLKRALNKEEVTTSLEINANDNDFFNGQCNDASCKVRMCLTNYHSNFCFFQSTSNYEYYSWERSVGKKIVDNWFENNVNLQKACRLQYDQATSIKKCSKDNLIKMTFNDGIKMNEGYIRLATKDEASLGHVSWVPNNGGYLAPEAWTLSLHNHTSGKSFIYDIKGNVRDTTETFTIRPVIEVKKI
ncbi:MAG: hypothetical protein HFI09_04350 [Bacilli bacterium]|nr:hypothetical protein [Bacilli bacterium]